MTVDEKNLYNKTTFIIDDDWVKCIDKFGITRTKEYAASYRENARSLVLRGVSFKDWCVEQAHNDPTFTEESISCKARRANTSTYPKGTKIRVIEGKEDMTPPTGAICEVRYIDYMGIIHVNFEGEGYALTEGVDKFEKVTASES